MSKVSTALPTVRDRPGSATADEDAAELRTAVRSVAESFGPSYFQRQVDEGGHARELWTALGSAGFLGIHLPAAFGGGGRGLREIATVVEETAIAGVPMMSILFSPGVVGTLIAHAGSPEQKARWLPGIAAGTLRVAFALTEAAAGSNAHRIATTGHLQNRSYLLNGEKVYVTGMESADLVIAVVRAVCTDEADAGRLTAVLIEADAPGISMQPIRTTMNMPEQTWRVRFDDVVVPVANRIGAEGRGLHVAFTGMNTERILASSLCTGIGRYALNKAVVYARSRTVWDQPIGAHQAVSHPLAAAHIDVAAAQLMTEKACQRYDSGQSVGELANFAKYLGAAAGVKALDAAIAAHGGNGIAIDTHLATYYFIARMFTMGPVSKEMVLNFVAEHSLGLPRSY